ncbi:MAG: YbhB/YbcL family Raf kinase inhibitor-like protein [Cyanobacteria bacterium QS_8_64_29]|nr:MAG: YbhB/YbcL family Raf kinase inhibitor-like protein [Cyanobacteria bacterium QS_8_64_29]
MKLESSAFGPEGTIPIKYSCDGEDISLPLSWQGVPEGTQSLALICDDPDAPGMTFVHWLIYNLPAEVQQLPENVPNRERLESGALQGENNFGKVGYGGPCPPGGTHRYFFRLYALDGMLDLGAGISRDRLERAMEGHILAQAELMGRYSRAG